MCRLTFYLGDNICLADLVTRPENSLINQSVKARERPEPLNGDGFGVAWYVNGHGRPARFRSLTPAWSNANLDELARVTKSRCILAHVRAATGNLFSVSEANCHPFRKNSFAFMHNGQIESFERLRRPLMNLLSDEGFNNIRGNTDTEHLFALIAEYLPDQPANSASYLARALEKGITQLHTLIDQHAPGSKVYLNLILTDGQNAVACRYSSDPDYIDSLYINQGQRYHCEEGQCWMDSAEDSAAKAVLISSEPLNEGPHWQPVPVNSLVEIDASLAVEIRPLSACENHSNQCTDS